MKTAKRTRKVAAQVGVPASTLRAIRAALTREVLRHGIHDHQDVVAVATAAAVSMNKDTVAGIKAADTIRHLEDGPSRRSR